MSHVPDYWERNNILACYAQSLCCNDNLVFRELKVGTVDEYLRAAASWAINTNHFDPRYDNTGKKGRLLSLVLQEHKRWEKMPSRCHPVTEQLLMHMHLTSGADEDSLEYALTDWHSVGYSNGMRKSEWCQDKHETKFKLAPDGSTLAFTEEDLTLVDRNGARLELDEVSPGRRAAGTDHKWRFQKNCQNGEVKSFGRNDAQPHKCCTRATERILRRARRLGVKPGEPLAVYKDKKGVVRRIHNGHVEAHLQKAVKVVYKIKDRNILKKLSCHSIRVGACVALHAAGKGGDFIKFWLRWRSDTFRDYLRNCRALAMLQIQALNSAHADKA